MQGIDTIMYTMSHSILGAILPSIKTGNFLVDTILMIIFSSIIMYIIKNGKDKLIDIFNHISEFFVKKEYNITITYKKFNIENKDVKRDVNKDLYLCIMDFLVNNHKNVLSQLDNNLNKDLSWGNEYVSAKTTNICGEIIGKILFIYKNQPIKAYFSKKIIGKEGSDEGTISSIYLSSTVGLDHLNEFIKEAYDTYVEKMYKIYDNNDLFYYDYKGHTTNAESHGIYKKYKLNSKREINSLFFDEKDRLIKLIDIFEKKEGIYKHNSVSNRLNILLHGVPGCGKTTFIKCISKYTNRHIINVNLSSIMTNADCIDIFFNTRFYAVNGGDKIPPNKRIYLLEDIDCLTHMIQKRDNNQNNNTNTNNQYNDKLDNKFNDKFDNDSDANILLKYLKEKDENKKINIANEKFNLSGLLNVLDGVLELSETIIIMTTNHPEKLDPALLRPGRININIKLGYINYDNAIKMIKFYYPNENIDHKLLYEHNFNDDKFTPAQIESLILNSTSFSEFLSLLIK